MSLTQGEFARFTARIAQSAATWAAECLDEPFDTMRPMSVSRFLEEMRRRLDHIEERAKS